MKCARHPDVETNLACGKCGQSICPKCLVQTPVGARCPDCARLKRLPTYQVSAAHYARAVGAGLVAAVVAGVVWGLIPLGGFFLLFLAAGVGYALGEAISLSVNRKRSRGLQVIGGLGVVLSCLVSRVSLSGSTVIFSFPAVGLGLGYALLALAIGISVAVSRLR